MPMGLLETQMQYGPEKTISRSSEGECIPEARSLEGQSEGNL